MRINYIALLGWSPEGEKELFTLEELTQEFDVKRISKSGAIFDMNKLKWINSQYIKLYFGVDDKYSFPLTT